MKVYVILLGLEGVPMALLWGLCVYIMIMMIGPVGFWFGDCNYVFWGNDVSVYTLVANSAQHGFTTVISHVLGLQVPYSRQ